MKNSFCYKQAHKSQGAAEAHRRGLIKRDADKRGQLSELNTYLCGACFYWHVGHRKQKPKYKSAHYLELA